MERELFTWEGWDGDPECMTFYDVTLIKPIGKFPIGTHFDSASIVQDDGVGQLQLTNWGDRDADDVRPCILMGEYKLHYVVGEATFEK